MTETTNIIWRKMVTRPTFTVLWTDSFICGLEWKLAEALGVGLTNNLFAPAEKGNVTWYCDETQFAAFGRRVVDVVKKDKDFITNNSKQCFNVAESLIRTAREISRETLAEKSPPELYELYLKFHEKMADHTLFMIVPLAVEKYVSEEVQKGLRRILEEMSAPQKFQEYFEVLTTATRLTYAEEEKLNLLKIAVRINKDHKITPRVKEEISAHVKKYEWMPVYALTHDPWDEKRFHRALETARENPEFNLTKAEEDIEKKKDRLEKVLQELQPKEGLLSLINTLQQYVYLRTYRTDALRQALYYVQPLIDEIASRTGETRYEVSYLSLNELEDLLKRWVIPDWNEIRERAQHYLLLKKKGVYKLVSNKIAIGDIIKSELKEERKLEDVLVLNGYGVFSGSAVGEVKIIRNPKDAGKMNKGDILVTTMTTPDMHGIIEHASAIVTDEGGITSHAALVSRELQIPCVIGTEIATRVLADGDIVSVDSERGVIKVLEKSTRKDN